jgi:hypothetical protein
MKHFLLGAMAILAATLSLAPAAQAQRWGSYEPGFRDGRQSYFPDERDEWQRRMEWREQRREFRRQQRELAEMRAFEAGKREAWQAQRGQGPGWDNGWGYR